MIAIEDIFKTYGKMITDPDGKMLLICPVDKFKFLHSHIIEKVPEEYVLRIKQRKYFTKSSFAYYLEDLKKRSDIKINKERKKDE